MAVARLCVWESCDICCRVVNCASCDMVCVGSIGCRGSWFDISVLSSCMNWVRLTVWLDGVVAAAVVAGVVVAPVLEVTGETDMGLGLGESVETQRSRKRRNAGRGDRRRRSRARGRGPALRARAAGLARQVGGPGLTVLARIRTGAGGGGG